MLCCCLGLLLFLSLRGLLSCLLLLGFCGLLLCAPARYRTGGCTDCGTRSRVTGDGSDRCASRCTLSRALHCPTLWCILSCLLSRLLLRRLLLLGTRRGWRGSL